MRYPELLLHDPASPPTWEFYRADELPEGAHCTAVGCVAIRNLDAGEVVLTFQSEEQTTDPERINTWETPSGGIEAGENVWDALCREDDEEVGVEPILACLFGYRKYDNTLSDNSRYANQPPITYMPYCWSYNEAVPGLPTDPNQPANASFRYDSLQRLARSGQIKTTEVAIIGYGLMAARYYMQAGQHQDYGNA